MTATATPPRTGARVWDALCRHIDGMAIGTTMAALHERGALALLAGQDRTGFAALRAEIGARPGFLHVALRLLADQGWIARRGEPGTAQLTIAPTPAGRIVMTELAGAYPAAVTALDDGEPFIPLARRAWDLPVTGIPPEIRRQVRHHLDGHLIAPAMHELSSGQASLDSKAETLALAGWADAGGLTADGDLALSLARQYRYPMTYLPLLRQVPALLFGGQAGDPADSAGDPADSAGDPADSAGDPADPAHEQADPDHETHLDRELDLRFSGDVFAAACREPFLALALPMFDRAPLDEQPALVVDTGCGDGTLLEVLYRAVRDQTERGRRLDERPLLMVGVDPSPVARRMSADRLTQAGVPHLILDGDIADPAGLERALAAQGLDARDALHVCKSAIHDRAYTGPAANHPRAGTRQGSVPPAGSRLPTAPPPGAGAYARPDGTAIPARSVALDLAALFRRWRLVASRHGWLVIEAHAVPAAVLAQLIGRTHATVLDATHGYACQYPVEPGVFAWAARAGGFVSRGHAEPGAATLGHTILTIDHFAAA